MVVEAIDPGSMVQLGHVTCAKLLGWLLSWEIMLSRDYWQLKSIRLSEYKIAMKFVVPNSDAVRLIRYSSFLWLGYLILLFTINQTLFPPPPDHPTIYYYLGFMGFLSLLCLGLSSWTKIQPLLGRAFIPIIIGIITVLPILATITVARLFAQDK